MLTDADINDFWERVFDLPDSQIAMIEDLYPEARALHITFEQINEMDPAIASILLEHPDTIIGPGKKILEERTHKNDLNIRISDLPDDARADISKLRVEHIGRLISVNGLVRKSSPVRPNIRVAVFKCLRCPARLSVLQDSQHLTEPLECYKDQEGCGRTVGSTRFKLLPEECYTVDLQRIELQENPEGLRGGTQPGRLPVILSHEITGTIQPGMRVTINGILRMRPDNDHERSTLNILELEANSFRLDDGDIDERKLTEDELEEIRVMSSDPELLDNMIRSIAPGIHGFTVEKEALLYQLLGGVPKTLDDGQRLRGDIHILLVGDPGVAKSQLLHYMANLAPRGVYASGKSSSAAGLTAAAVKDDFGEGRWMLEAGALVQADRGLAAVDELDKMNDKDRSALHEAMESQIVSVAKAGITATLQCRCSLLGGANPSLGRFDIYEPIAGQIDLPPTLLSRFDLIFAIFDHPEPKQDQAIAEHICRGHSRAGALQHIDDEMARDILHDTMDIRPIYDRDKIRRYVVHARAQSPILTPEAYQLIVDHYLKIRALGAGENSTVPITPRQLEAFIRLSEASAKLHLSKYVRKEDVERAIVIVQYYLAKVTLDEAGRPDIDKLMSGTGKSERDKIKHVLSAIRKGITARDDLLAEARQDGIAESETERIIQELLRAGRIYEPKFDNYQVLT
jgi:replicative DNA helicase Mcm